ncbi:MAG: amine dehydrogenase large subunit [Candidatus Binataceae bacterium]
MLRRAAPLFAVLLAIFPVLAFAQVPAEGVKVRDLPPPSPHWAFVYTGIAAFPSDYPSAVTIIDGDRMEVLGSIDGGFISGFAIAPDHRELYMADTFYSRGSRGKRTDVVTIYNARTLAPAGEVIIPPKRQLSAQDNQTTAVTPDGRFLLVMNMTPATSVSVVDLHARKFAGEMELAGCTEVLVTGPRRFSSLCGDGSILTTDFNDQAKITHRSRMKPFFDATKDPVFALPVMIGKEAYFVSYHGIVHPVDLAAEPPRAGKPWPLVTGSDAAKKWSPGGMQPLAVSVRENLIYVLMHPGGEWTHKDPGKEVWVFDPRTHKRVRRIMLKAAASAIMVSTDRKPLLFAASEPGVPGLMGSVAMYSADTGRLAGAVGGLALFWEHIYGL